jgi:hypothetical protein
VNCSYCKHHEEKEKGAMHSTNLISGLILALSMIFTPALSQAGNGNPPSSYRGALNDFKARQTSNEKSPYSPEERAVMQRAKASLAQRMPDPGIKVGKRAPDFTLLNAFGQPVKLSDAL